MLTRFSWALIVTIIFFVGMWDSLGIGSWWWPKTTGQVDKLDLLSHRPSANEYDADLPCLTIYYHFRVNGKEYKDTDIPHYVQDATKILEWSKVYPPGSSVEVYYNPKNPKQSMLFPAQRLRACLILGTLMGSALVFTLWQRLRRKTLS